MALVAVAGILACVTAKMHAGELEIDEPLVRRLLAEQFPHWDSAPLRRIEPSGTDHAIFRLGDGLSARLPRVDGPTDPGGKQFMWLPKLSPLLPVDIPVPIAQGRPGEGYPWFWEITPGFLARPCRSRRSTRSRWREVYVR